MAEEEARIAAEELLSFNVNFQAAEGYYALGEIRLWIGDLSGADEAFRSVLSRRVDLVSPDLSYGSPLDGGRSALAYKSLARPAAGEEGAAHEGGGGEHGVQLLFQPRKLPCPLLCLLVVHGAALAELLLLFDELFDPAVDFLVHVRYLLQ